MSRPYTSPVPASSSLPPASYYASSAAEHNLHHLQHVPDPARQPSTGNTPTYSPQLDAESNDFDRFAPASQHPSADLQHGPSAPAQHDMLDPQDRFTHERLAQGVLNLHPDSHHPDHSSVDHGLPQDDLAYLHDTPEPHKKRSKVSRACDECRRKKIRCDSAENGVLPCANCTRTKAACAFSRQPQKRGPARGYIKKLADRLIMLESKLTDQGVVATADDAAQLESQLSAGSAAAYMLDMDDSLLHSRLHETNASPYSPAAPGRKRTHSMSEIDSVGAGAGAGVRGDEGPGRIVLGWNDQSYRHTPSRAALPPPPPPPPPAPPQPHVESGNGISSQETTLHRDGPDVDSHGETGEARDAWHRDHTAPAELDDAIIDEYYRLIHQTFPILPHSKAKIRDRLGNCPGALQDAFVLALEVTMRTYPSTTLAPPADAVASETKAASLIATCQYIKGRLLTTTSRLVHLQATVLMALQSDNNGPANLCGRAGPSRTEWLGRAVGIANSLRLYTAPSRDKSTSDSSDTDTQLGRRIWWTLFILERWHAASIGAPGLMMDERRCELTPEDQILLGENTYHLARLSFIMGHISTTIMQSQEHAVALRHTLPLITTALAGELNRFRESIESLLLGPPNLIHLVFWHVHLLIQRLSPSAAPQELMNPATRMASVLNSTHTIITPLNHHFAALSAITLVELAEWSELRLAAELGIKDICEALHSRHGFLSHHTSTGWDSAIRDLVLRKRGSAAALDRLADVAVGSAASAVAPEANLFGSFGRGGKKVDFDPSVLAQRGYLEALVGEKPF